MARKIKKIFVHCTASRQSWSVDALLKEFRNKGWHYPGYHWVVTSDGKYTQLMTEDLPSNGVKGHNYDSVNVAYMGGISRIKECPGFDAIPEYADI